MLTLNYFHILKLGTTEELYSPSLTLSIDFPPFCFVPVSCPWHCLLLRKLWVFLFLTIMMYINFLHVQILGERKVWRMKLICLAEEAFCSLLCVLFATATATRELAALPRLKNDQNHFEPVCNLLKQRPDTHFLKPHSEVWWQLRATVRIRSVGWRSGELLMSCSGSTLIALQPNSLPEMGWWRRREK